MDQQTSLGGACLVPRPVNWLKGTVSENPQASYYRARYYDPQRGRFLNEDPIRFAGSVNFYSYVSNNPVVRIDPSGLIHQAWNEKPYDGRLHDDPARA
jgi:RHS repeat-associated protein